MRRSSLPYLLGCFIVAGALGAPLRGQSSSPRSTAPSGNATSDELGPDDRAPDDAVARLQALAAIPDTEEAASARERLAEFALGTDAARAEAAVEALGSFGRHAASALEQVVESGATQSARQRALELRLAQRQPGDGERFAAFAIAELPMALRLLALDGVGDDPAALKTISPLLRTSEPRLQTRVLRLLAAAHDPAAIAFAHSTLAPDARAPVTLQVAAIDVLREERSRAAIERLIDVAGFEAGEVRQFAQKSLLVIERGSVLLTVIPMLTEAAPVSRALVAIEIVRHVDLAELPEVQAALRSTLSHASAEVRVAAIEAVAALGDREALPKLERAALDPDPMVAASAIRGVTLLRRDELPWRQRLLQLAHSRLPAQRLAAVAALADSGVPAATPLLLELLLNESWVMREQAARGLGQIRTAAAIAPLIERVAQDRRRVRVAAAAALRRITGMPFQDNERDWRRWWADQPTDFVPPPLEQVLAFEERLAANRVRGTTRSSFYGVPVESEHLALVVDISGSMGGPGAEERTKLDVAKDEVAQVVAKLETGACLNLLFFAGEVRRWRPRLAKLDRRAIAEATAFARSQRANGATNLFAALALALEDPEVDTVYVLSDGEPTAGRFVHPTELRAAIRHKNSGGRVLIHAISIGGSSALLRHLAEDSGGNYVER